MQDFTGVPAVVDLAAMRDALARAGGDPALINPQIPVDLVIDHSVMVDQYATPEAFGFNVAMEMARNHERYVFLRWGSWRSATSAWCRRAPASATRSISNTWPVPCGAKNGRGAGWPTPTPCSAPTATPP